ncbi:MFS transporter [Actinomadura xylanilytica]|uniref:MFS transporter n=1 Tax=Actinomadura xylanilytica TaxID=887459 RepID=UPI00255AA911|nr:MFS transporter [Actinomadura xylanilytica]MDL4770651.1 MFS transporter [Actinomadura xylanilytica]
MIGRPVLRRARLGTGGAFLLAGLLTGVWNTRLPALQTAHELSTRQVGLVIVVWGVAALAGMAALRRLMARRDSRVALRVALPLSAAGLGLCGQAPSYPLLLAAVVVFGAAFGAAEVTVNAQGSAVERASGRPVMNGMHACWSLGALAGGLTGFAAVLAGLGLPATFAATAVVAAPAAVALGLTYIRDDAAATGEIVRPARPGRLPRIVPVIGVLAFCALLVEGAVADWSALYLRDTRGTAESLAALGHPVFGAGMLAGRLCGDRLRSVIGAPALLAIAGAATAAAVALTLAGGGPAIALTGFALMGVAVCTVGPLAFSLAGTAAPRQESAAIARTGTLGYSGLMLGPVLISLVAGASSMRAGLAVLLAPALFSAVGGPLIARRTRGPARPVWTTPGAGVNVPSAIHRTTWPPEAPGRGGGAAARVRLRCLVVLKAAGVPVVGTVWFGVAGLPATPVNLAGFGLLAAMLLYGAVTAARGGRPGAFARWFALPGAVAAGLAGTAWAVAAGPDAGTLPGLALAVLATAEYVMLVSGHRPAPPGTRNTDPHATRPDAPYPHDTLPLGVAPQLAHAARPVHETGDRRVAPVQDRQARVEVLTGRADP